MQKQFVEMIKNESGEKVRIEQSTCLDFVYFRQLIRQARKPDDNISIRLNKINPSDPKQSRMILDFMKKLHEGRERALEFCQGVIQREIENTQDNPATKSLLQKEVYYIS